MLPENALQSCLSQSDIGGAAGQPLLLCTSHVVFQESFIFVFVGVLNDGPGRGRRR